MGAPILHARLFDSGWRNVSTLLLNGWTGIAHARRAGELIDLRFRLHGSGATANQILALPVGWRTGSERAAGVASTTGQGTQVQVFYAQTASFYSAVRANSQYGSVLFTASDSEPPAPWGLPS